MKSFYTAFAFMSSNLMLLCPSTCEVYTRLMNVVSEITICHDLLAVFMTKHEFFRFLSSTCDN